MSAARNSYHSCSIPLSYRPQCGVISSTHGAKGAQGPCVCHVASHHRHGQIIIPKDMQDRSITWLYILIVKWSFSPHNFSCIPYLWVCQVTQAGLKPASAPGQCRQWVNYWPCGRVETRTLQSGTEMLTWAYLEDTKSIWVWLGGEQPFALTT